MGILVHFLATLTGVDDVLQVFFEQQVPGLNRLIFTTGADAETAGRRPEAYQSFNDENCLSRIPATAYTTHDDHV